MTKMTRWLRRHKVASAFGAIVAAGLGFAVAWALSLRAPMTGGGNFQAPTGVEFVNTPTVAAQSNVTCTVSRDGGTLNLQMDGGITGGRCDIVAQVARTGADPGTAIRLDHVEFADATTETIVTNCGTMIPGSGSLSFTFRVELSGTPGVFSARPDAGVYATDGVAAC